MNATGNNKAEELEIALAHFTGTDEYHRLRYPWLRRDFLLTDGVKYLADHAGVIGGTAYWLIDIIASHQKNKRVFAEGFQTWRLYVNHGGWPAPDPENPEPAIVLKWQKESKAKEGLVTCDDGNGHVLVSQEIPFADFVFDGIRMYATNDEFNGIVVMLPSEY